MYEKCIIGVQLDGVAVKAFDVCIKKTNVYINYSMRRMAEAHCSYHASGEQHTKKNGHYVECKRMPNGQWERMIEWKMEPSKVITRSSCQDTVGWLVGQLTSALHPLNESADVMVDARSFAESSLLLLKVCVVGDWAREHKMRLGFRKVMSHRFGTGLRIEIEAFETSPSAPSIVSIETLQ
jgi:hypothetical protein